MTGLSRQMNKPNRCRLNWRKSQLFSNIQKKRRLQIKGIKISLRKRQ